MVHHQRAGSQLPNAVGIAFYEHLFDDWSLRKLVVPWLSPEVRADVSGLWELFLDQSQLAELRGLFDRDPTRRWTTLRDVVPASRTFGS